MGGTSDYPGISEGGGLSRDQLARVIRKLGKGKTAAPILRLPRGPGNRRFPLSFGQQRLWFLERLQPGSAAYNLAGGIDLRGSLDVVALSRALSEIVRRHESLRTSFRSNHGEPAQIVDPPETVAVRVVDLTGLGTGDQAAELRKQTALEARRPFDLGAGSLLRLRLLRLRSDAHLLLLTLHHIIADGWSLGVLLRELAALYQAFAADERPSLPNLRVQYVDYAQWQRERLTGETLERQLAYWRAQLDGVTALVLPTDRPRPAVRSGRGATLPVSFPQTLRDSLEELGRKQGMTLFMVLLAAFQALLSRYSGQSDIAVGTPVANRERREIEDLIGFFVNTLVLRGDLSGLPRFTQLLARTRETALAGYAHQDVSFEQLVEELQPRRDLAWTPLFQVAFSFQNAAVEPFRLGETTFRPLAIDSGSSKFDLTLLLSSESAGLAGTIEYSTDLFDRSTAVRLGEHLSTLLASIVARPESYVHELGLLSPAERRQLVVEWNDTERLYAQRDVCLHRWIEVQAARTPDAVASVFEGEELSYGELDARSNQLAWYLRSLGVGAEELVGVFVERSLEMIVGLLGVLKAGGAYVPLDPSYPVARLAFMVEDAGAAVLLTQDHLVPRLPESPARVVRLDGDWPRISRLDTTPLAEVATADSLAYVIYTSGSTGRPKGAANTHSAIVNRLLWMQEAYGLAPQDRVLQKTPFSFDVSVWELFWPLMCGARQVIARPEGHKDTGYLVDLIAAEGITTLHFVPSMLATFLEEGDVERCNTSGLRRVICSGEALPFDLQHRFYARQDAELHNLYGPTEAAVDVTWWPCERRPSRSMVPIGRPIANTEIRILDRHLLAAPIGVPGELLIGGVQLMRGYHERPGLTAEKLVPDPLGEVPGGRLYKTGDLSRVLVDGNVEYLGRLDHQVKIRGLRIELGEIEATLASHPAINEAVVLAEGHGGDTRLVAFLVPDEVEALPVRRLLRLEESGALDERLRGEQVSCRLRTASEVMGAREVWKDVEVLLGAIRKAAGEKLPDYMVPSSIVLRDRLPLLANGKVDRRALAELAAQANGHPAAVEYVAPRNAVEVQLAEIWSEVLNAPADRQIGVHDNFFALGGHSLLAMRAISRIRRAFGVELALQELFGAPTVAGLAAAVDTALRSSPEGEAQLPSILEQRRVPGETIPLSLAQRRLWFLAQLEPWNPGYNIPAAVVLEGVLERSLLQRSLTEIVRRHEILRTRFGQDGEGGIQIIDPPRPQALPTVDLSALPAAARESQVRRLAKAEAVRLFDLERGPLLRTILLRLAEEEHVFLLNQHHIVSDGWSIGVLVRELGALYRAFTSGDAVPLEELPLQYADFALWQHSSLQGETLERQLAYWRTQLGGVTALELPTDRPRPPVRSGRGATLPVSFPQTLPDSLEELGRERGVTLFMVLLAAFQALLSRYSGQSDIAVGSPIAGRRWAELEGLIGFFVNTLVLRGDLAGDPTFRELLGRTRGMVLAAATHQELPFDKLVEELQPERNLSVTPLFQVMLAFETMALERVRLPPLELTPREIETGTAKFDLTLTLTNTDRRLVGSLEYDRELFDEVTIRRLARNFSSLLRDATANPETRISELPLWSVGERQQLLVEWNDRASTPRRDQSLNDLFEAQVARTPEAPALRCRGKKLSFRELDERANQLAHHLRSLGPGRRACETVVGICFDRSLEMVVAMLAALKAGGAFVPLDPSYPRERLRFIVEDTRSPVLLTRERLREVLPEHGAKVLCVDRERLRIAAHGTDRPAVPHLPGALAYVIYTSGSTGQPKGVAIEHRSAVTLMHWARAVFSPEELSGVAAVTSINFDLSIFEIFVPLCWGGTAILAENALELATLDERDAVRLVNTVPSAIAELVRQQALPNGARTVNLAGEPLPQALVDEVYGCRGVRRVLNLYGPSEDTTYSTFAVVPPGQAGQPTIGRPVADTRAYLLDRRARPVPLGAVGELYLGGSGLARGYLRRPALTAERFLPDGWSDMSGERLYRTGDLARYRLDGELAFLGRTDHQVKIRGFRIELGEIEAVLLGRQEVSDAVVEVRQDGTNDRRLVAYLTAAGGRSLDPSALRRALHQTLPAYMVPAAFVVLESLPLLPNGKVNRRALPAPDQSGPRAPAVPRTGIERTIAAVWRKTLGLQRVGIDDNFFDLGGHSLLLVRVQGELREKLSADLALTELFQFPTIASLAAHLGSKKAERPAAEAGARRAEKRRDRRRRGHNVAILAMAGRFPGAADLDRLWRNLRDGVESISFFSERELEESGVEPHELRHPDYVKAFGALADADLFDASFFGLAPREAESLDPQQRLFLECAWEALERAGRGAQDRQGAVGVFAGASFSTYLLHLYRSSEPLSSMRGLQALLGGDKDFLSTRVSYKLDLKGPSITVQTACSSSLVAVHMACQSLLSGECDLALAGGASVTVPLESGYLYQEDGILSRDGHCRAFSADAGGTVPGNGVGVVVLKPLDEARADGDPILAVIRGSAVNNDGAVKVGYTAPSVEGQAAALSEACRMAEVEPGTVGYVETHGTGTPLGDPIEVAALSQVFGDADRKRSCFLGSVKTNLGHLDAAAGVAGLIKTVLALRHREIPPSLHCLKTHPDIDFESGRFEVNTELRQWPPPESHPRRAGVSSFGIGGTNAHVVLEEAPAIAPSDPQESQQLLVLSAKTESALRQIELNLAEHLSCDRDLNLADVAYTLQVGRQAFEHRRIVVCRSLEEAVAGLEAENVGLVGRFEAASSPSLVFLFPGQGTQAVNMGLELYRYEPVFRRQVDRCAELLEPRLGFDLRTVLYPRAGEAETAAERLRETTITQPILFVVEYALARLWQERVGAPAAMIGHSLGEYVAACLAGVFSLEDALALVVERGRLMGELPFGAMLSVPLPEAEVESWLGPDLALAAVNGPDRTVVSGTIAAVEVLEERLAARGVKGQRLATSHAFHSAMMEPIFESFVRRVQAVELRPPRIPYVSNLTGTWIEPSEATTAEYWIRHLRRTVRFGDGVTRLLEDPDVLFVEVGPGRTLGSLVRRLAKVPPTVVSSLPDPRRGGGIEHWLTGVGQLWLTGYPVDWQAFSSGQRRHALTLPTYPFERRRYWIEEGTRTPEHRNPPDTGQARTPEHQLELADWFYLPFWKPAAPLPRPAGVDPAPGSPQLLFVDGCGLGEKLARRLESVGHEPIVVRCGPEFRRLDEHEYAIDPRRREDYARLLAELAADGRTPESIAHLWTVGQAGQASASDPGEVFRRTQHVGFYSLLFLVQALAGEKTVSSHRLIIVSSSMHSVRGEASQPAKAPLLALCRVIPWEYAHLGCRSVDVELPREGSRQEEDLVAGLLAEIAAPVGTERLVALRQGRRWVEDFAPVRLEPDEAFPSPLRRHGVYLITGGLGHPGLQLAEHLARTVQARLVLVERSPFPDRDEWPDWIATHGPEDAVSRKIRRLEACEEAGGEILVNRADLADEEAMHSLLARARERFGPPNGVIHAEQMFGDHVLEPLAQTGPEECEAQFRSKVYGLLTLEKVLQEGFDDELDFCLLFSSLATVLGGPGYGAYVAANLFMDAFAQERRRSGAPWTSVCWDGWEQPQGDDRDIVPAHKPVAAISPSQGGEAFERLLQWLAEPRIVVSMEELAPRIERWLAAGANTEAATGEAARHPRPALRNAYIAPRNDRERAIAEIWQELLGVGEVGVHDDFFELGGDSLIAVELGSRVRSHLRLELSLRSFFDAPTVAGIAAVPASDESPSKQTKADEEQQQAEIVELLEGIEALSSGEVQDEIALLESSHEQTGGVS